MIDYTKLSKEVSYALRHNPFKYGLEIDEEGWVLISQLLSALHKDKKWSNVTENDLVLMIEKSKKKRHIILNGKIKANEFFDSKKQFEEIKELLNKDI